MADAVIDLHERLSEVIEDWSAEHKAAGQRGELTDLIEALALLAGEMIVCGCSPPGQIRDRLVAEIDAYVASWSETTH